MSDIKVSLRYATALLDISIKENIVEQVVDDMMGLRKTLIESRDLRNLFHSPVIQNWKKKEIINELLQGKISKFSLDFLQLLIHKNRENIISTIIDEFERIYNKEYNRAPVTITTAVELNDSLKDNILKKLFETINKIILPTFVISPDIKGGIIIQVDDWVFDSSIKNQLEHLRAKLAEDIQLN